MSSQKDFFDGIDRRQPALVRASKLGEKASTLGFDWDNAHDAFKKIEEEITELKNAIAFGDRQHMEEELGDLLHAIAQTARHLGIDPELALNRGNEKFIARFQQMLSTIGGEEPFKNLDQNQMNELWRKVKK